MCGSLLELVVEVEYTGDHVSMQARVCAADRALLRRCQLSQSRHEAVSVNWGLLLVGFLTMRALLGPWIF